GTPKARTSAATPTGRKGSPARCRWGSRDDFEQVRAGNYVVKVIYLPYPQFQDLAVAVPGEIVSTRLEPGADPIAEALQRGSLLLVVRLGNIDLEAPGTPAMDAPSPYQKPPPPGILPPPGYMPGAATMGPPGMMPPPGMYPGMGNQGPMVPYGMANGGRSPVPSGIPLPPGVTLPPVPGAPGSPASVPAPVAPSQQPAGPPLPSGATGKVSDTQPVAFRAPTPDETPAKKSGWWSLFSKKS